jgi:hypothetical protein
MIGMLRAFAVLGDSGVADPRALADSIGTTLLSTATGLFLFPIGVVLLSISLVFFFRRPAPVPPPLRTDPTPRPQDGPALRQ